MKRRFAIAFTAAALLLAPGAALPAFDPVNDDTDIFLANPAFSATRPNVLIFVDNTANWAQATGFPAPLDNKYNAVRTALANVVGAVNDNFNVGLGLFVETGSPNNNTDGGYMRYGIRQMTATNKTMLVSVINSLDINGDKGNSAVYSLAVNEMFNYFAGRLTFSGHGKDKKDAGDRVWFAAGRQAHAGSPVAAGALPENGGTTQTYVSPIVDSCQKNFIIVISNGEANDNAASLATAQGFLSGITGANPPGTISITPSGSQGIWSDEYAKFMANGDCNLSIGGVQNVYTYTIDVIPKLTGQGPDHTALLKSMATNGKGKYFAVTSATGLEDALKAIFNEVQAVNSVFASTTLPVSVNVRGTNLNQVYIGVFRPDPNKSPRWLGNLKLYKLGVDTATERLFLADANGAPAENASTGFISSNATSFWTTSSTYWGFRDPTLNGVGGASDAPDGDLVEKGGAAQRQRALFAASHTAPNLRSLYTCVDGAGGLCAPGASLSATPFDTSIISAADVGAYTTKPVVSITSAGTTATATVTAHGFASGNTVRIEGSTPNVFNGDFSISVVDPNTFTYTLPSAPDATTGRVTAPNHLLIAGDVACVFANEPGYTNCTFPGYAPVTPEGANAFTYPMSGPETGNATGFTVFGGRLITSVTGFGGTTTATITLPNHGFPGPIVTTEDYLFSNDLSQWYTATCFNGCKSATVVDANTLSIQTDNVISGATNTARVTAPNHGFSTGQSLTIFGSAVAGFNGVHSITKLDANAFTFSSTEPTADLVSPMRAGHQITTITHPTTGSATNRDTATVTTSTAHGFAVGQTVNIFGTGALPAAGYDGVFVVQSTPTPTTFTIFNTAIDSAPTPRSPALGIAGYAVTAIQPVLSATGLIHFYRRLTVSSISPATSAQGTVTAGRPIDSDNSVRDLIVNWVRSTDNRDNEDANGIATDVRASVHGDVLHSRPATINYSRFPAAPAPANDNDIYAFYGSNDGLLRAIKGGIASDETGVSAGDERWAFIPKEFHSKLKRLREQTPAISNIAQKDYFFDGSIGVFQKDVVPVGGRAGTFGDDPGDKVYIFLSLRRGGNFVYALDVTDPAVPKLLWRRGSGEAPPLTGWNEVGQTWSEPKVTRVNLATPIPGNPDGVVLIFGAGYDDAVEDINPCLLEEFNPGNVVRKPIGSGTVTFTTAGSCTITNPSGGPTTFNRTKGRGILVVDAFTGNVLWQVGPGLPTGATHNLAHPDMTCAIPSDVTVLDRNRDGFADRVYVGDTCGNVWRVEVSEPDPRDWKVTKIAAFSSGTNTTISGKRKFLFPPDLVLSKDVPASGSPTFFAVLLGSGDREHAFDANVQNAFFMVKDRDDAIGSPAAADNSTTRSINASTPPGSPPPVTSTDVFDATNVSGVNDFGWKIDIGAGEKVVGSAVTIAGTTFFNTNQPSATAGGGACGSNLGIARQYLVSYVDAAATTDLNALGTLSIANRSTIYAGGGYLPSPVPVVVEIDGKKYQAVISGTSVQTPPGLTLDARIRTYWYREIDQ